MPKKGQRPLRTIYNATARRLESYGLFSEEAIQAVATVAELQAGYTSYRDFFRDMGITTPQLHQVSKGVGVPVLDVPNRSEKQKGILVIHLPMSNPLDENQLYHIATVAALLREYRIIAFGNPSGAPYYYRHQNKSMVQLVSLALTRHRRPLVVAELDYLSRQGVVGAHHIGYSFGAHKALIEAGYLTSAEVASLTLIDPVAHPRGLRQLIDDFRRTFAPMGKYVDRTNIPSYFEARRAAAKTAHHKPALRRPVSVAIGVLMARFDLIPELKRLLIQHDTLKVSVAWGTRSELGNDAHLSTSLAQLAHDRPEHIKSIRLKDDSHALANDIHLYAAIVYTALNR